jgi:hypothetical protein
MYCPDRLDVCCTLPIIIAPKEGLYYRFGPVRDNKGARGVIYCFLTNIDSHFGERYYRFGLVSNNKRVKKRP